MDVSSVSRDSLVFSKVMMPIGKFTTQITEVFCSPAHLEPRIVPLPDGIVGLQADIGLLDSFFVDELDL